MARFGLLILLIISFGIVFAGDDQHLKRHIGDIESEHWLAPEDESSRVNPIPKDAKSIKRGRKLYVQSCASCHGIHARGDGPEGKAITPKPANLKEMSGMHTDGEIAWKINNGRGEMPGWEYFFTKNQIWDLVNYIQSLSEGNQKKEHSEPANEHSH